MLEKLLKKLEAATGGSRELDMRIAQAIRTAQVPSELLRLEKAGLAFRDSDAHETGYCLAVLPHWTTSADAALTLVPEGWLLTMVQESYTHWTVAIRSPDALYDETVGQGGARDTCRVQGKDASAIQRPTFALALCIASLKARRGA